jgi:hypothetical protein
MYARQNSDGASGLAQIAVDASVDLFLLQSFHEAFGDGIFILVNRHIVELKNGTLVLNHYGYFLRGRILGDFIVHEPTHARQSQLEREHGWKRTRGAHRDLVRLVHRSRRGLPALPWVRAAAVNVAHRTAHPQWHTD